MSKRRFRSIFISDTHLCSRDCRADCLLSFLKHNKAENLFLVGDIIDVWQLKRRWHWPQPINNVIQKILSCAKKGTKVTYIPGNHDEGLRDFTGNEFGDVHLLQDAIHVTADGRRLLVIHGDVFDAAVQHNRWLAIAGDAAYSWLIWLNGMFNFFRRMFHLPYWSLSGYVKGKVKNAVSYINSFEEVVIGYAKQTGVDGVICGHIHQPKIRVAGGLTYYNTGDWIENCTALVEHFDGRMELCNWLQEWPLVEAAAGVKDEEEEEAHPWIGPPAIPEFVLAK